MLSLARRSFNRQNAKYIDIDVSVSHSNFPLKVGCLKEIARTALILEGVHGPGELSISLVDDEEITKLNDHYLKHPWPTDVIAFPSDNVSLVDLRQAETAKWVLGDVVVSLETAARQAEHYRHSFYAELALLIVHGILHLLGYSDASSGPRKIMRRKEREILKVCEIA